MPSLKDFIVCPSQLASAFHLAHRQRYYFHICLECCIFRAVFLNLLYGFRRTNSKIMMSVIEFVFSCLIPFNGPEKGGNVCHLTKLFKFDQNSRIRTK